MSEKKAPPADADNANHKNSIPLSSKNWLDKPLNELTENEWEKISADYRKEAFNALDEKSRYNMINILKNAISGEVNPALKEDIKEYLKSQRAQVNKNELEKLLGELQSLINETKQHTKTPEQISFLDDELLKGFYLLVQSANTNQLQKKLTEKIVDPAQLDLYGHGHIFSKDFRLHIHLYNELQHGVSQSTAQLLDALMITATREGLKDTLIKLPLKEYMYMRDLSDEKETRAQVKRDLDALTRIKFEYKGTGKQRGAWIEVYIFGGTRAQIKNGDIVFRFNQDFYDSFKASETGQYMFMYFPHEALKANIKYNPYTYWLARKIAEHKRINLGKPNADTISVKTLIDACPNFPTYDEVIKSNDRHVDKRIIEPFERDMDKITETLSWSYAGEQPKDYHEFINSMVSIVWRNYPDTKKLEAEKAKQAKKIAADKMKTPSTAPQSKKKEGNDEQSVKNNPEQDVKTTKKKWDV